MLVAAPVALAEPTDNGVEASAVAATPAAPLQTIGYGALPGGVRVPDAVALPKGAVEVSTIDGYGYRTGLLAPDHKMARTLGSIAVAYGITDLLSIGLSLDGRYDKHSGNGTDDGYVGDPHLLLRAAKLAGTARFGGQLGLWVPGKDAPSIAGSAISVDIRALASLPAGPGMLSFEAGFRLDNSANSVPDPAGAVAGSGPSRLSLQDRVSLGVSDYNVAFGGAHLLFPFGQAWLGVEASVDAFLGGPPKTGGAVTIGHAELTDGTLTIRGGVSGGFHINDQFALLAFVELAKVPYVTLAQVMDGNIPLIPYEPVATFGIGLSATFGNSKPAPQFKGCAYTAEGCPAVESPILADISGTVVDDADKPVVGAKVTLTLKNVTVDPVATDDKGKYGFKGVRIGTKADATKTKPAVHRIDETTGEVKVEVDQKKPGSATITKLDEGSGNTVPPIKLDPLLPPGQLRGVVHSLPNGKPIDKAVITVMPGDKKIESGADGTFTIDLAPGSYKISVKASGFATQELEFTIQASQTGDVVIKNIDLHK